jgi:cell division protein FtsB
MFAAISRPLERLARHVPDGQVLLAGVFLALMVMLQYPLWIGKGSWLRVWDLDRQVTAARGINAERTARNQTLEAEVRDLKDGMEAVEERARLELGMVKPDEVLYQFAQRR